MKRPISFCKIWCRARISRDGTMNVQTQQFNPPSASTAESKTDVAANYAAWPAFGDYVDLLRVERQAEP